MPNCAAVKTAVKKGSRGIKQHHRLLSGENAIKHPRLIRAGDVWLPQRRGWLKAGNNGGFRSEQIDFPGISGYNNLDYDLKEKRMVPGRRTLCLSG